jgi:signal recognition particle subunit SRP54
VLTDIASALLSADVNIKFVARLQQSVKTQVSLHAGANQGDGINIRKLIQKVVVEELTAMLDSENEPYQFRKGKPNVVMFVGLQGSGKTTTCTKFAYHYMKKGWRVGLVCADTFRAGAFEQLKMNAAKIKCPFFGHKKETDPVRIAEEGVNFFKEQKFEIIIVDTSGRHKQEASLFEEMQQVAATVKPDTAIFVMDSSIGQACFDQAQAFNKTIKVGSVIITKLDGHAKGGGALSAVAATESPVIFIGTGEHFDDLEPFEASGFIKRLLGLGDISGLMKTVKEAISDDKQKQMAENISKGVFSMKDMRDQFSSVLSMGPLGQVVSMIPGLNQNMMPKGREKEGTARIKRFLCMMDSMTQEELNSTTEKPFTEGPRIFRIAKGSGTRPQEVVVLV